VVRPGQKPVVVPALPIGAVADTTGAGDAFAAGFLGVFLHGGDPIDAVSAGHSLAAAVLPQPGASLAGERC
jgi:sugar/nucleoside kinase (ribokinase family)